MHDVKNKMCINFVTNTVKYSTFKGETGDLIFEEDFLSDSKKCFCMYDTYS